MCSKKLSHDAFAKSSTSAASWDMADSAKEVLYLEESTVDLAQ